MSCAQRRQTWPSDAISVATPQARKSGESGIFLRPYWRPLVIQERRSVVGPTGRKPRAPGAHKELFGVRLLIHRGGTGAGEAAKQHLGRGHGHMMSTVTVVGATALRSASLQGPRAADEDD